MALLMGTFLLGIPVQLSDSFTESVIFARARLPEDLGARGSDSAQPIEIAAAFRMCAAD